MIFAIISGLVTPDGRGQYFSPSWGLHWEWMVRDRAVDFAWGHIILASLYRYLHEYAYLNGRALGASVMLLHVRAWEHISILQP